MWCPPNAWTNVTLPKVREIVQQRRWIHFCAVQHCHTDYGCFSSFFSTLVVDRARRNARGRPTNGCSTPESPFGKNHEESATSVGRSLACQKSRRPTRWASFAKLMDVMLTVDQSIHRPVTDRKASKKNPAFFAEKNRRRGDAEMPAFSLLHVLAGVQRARLGHVGAPRMQRAVEVKRAPEEERWSVRWTTRKPK